MAVSYRLGNLERGDITKLGGRLVDGGVHFAFHTHPKAYQLSVSLFDKVTDEELRIALTPEQVNPHSVVWHGFLPCSRADAEGMLYGVRISGPYSPMDGLYFNENKLVIDTRAYAIDGKVNYKDGVIFPYYMGSNAKMDLRALSFDPRDSKEHMPRCRIVDMDSLIEEFGFRSGPTKNITDSPLVELHVKGATRLRTDVEHPGTYLALGSDPFIKFLKERDIKRVQIMPIQRGTDEENNYWRYNTLGFFAPEPAYASGTMPVEREVLMMLRKLRDSGIDVIMDVVYNHTPEGNQLGPLLSYKAYDGFSYIHSPSEFLDLYLRNESGTGNTLDPRHPRVQDEIVDSMIHWSHFCQGLRFDLGAILAKDDAGQYSTKSRLFDRARTHPRLKNTILIAEAWSGDGSIYALKDEPGHPLIPYNKFNDQFREDITAAAFGTNGVHIGKLATRMLGSPDLLASPERSVNYLTCHDGYTLFDRLCHAMGVSPEEMQRRMDDPEARREPLSRMQYALASLGTALGTPFITLGHVRGKTQNMHHNAYDQDNETSWVQWTDKGWQHDLMRFFDEVMDFRGYHPSLCTREHVTGEVIPEINKRGVVFFRPDGAIMQDSDWDHQKGYAYWLAGSFKKKEQDEEGNITETIFRSADGRIVEEPNVLIMENPSNESLTFRVPGDPEQHEWIQAINSTHQGGEVHEPSRHKGQTEIMLPPHSKVVFEEHCPERAREFERLAGVHRHTRGPRVADLNLSATTGISL